MGYQMSLNNQKSAEYALIVVFVLIGFFIGLLVGGSGAYFMSSGSGDKTVENTLTKIQCASGEVVEDAKKCPKVDNAIAAICVNQTKYVYRNETVFLPCNCLKDCGVDRPLITTTTFPQKPKVYCSSDTNCGSTNISGIKCSITAEAYRLLTTPKCFTNTTQPFCIYEQSKEVIKACGTEVQNEICKPGVGCIVQAET